MEVLAKNIKKLRLNAELTQQQLAERLSVSPDAISSWERAINTPPLEQTVEIARMFGITIDDLVGVVIDTTNYEKIDTISSALTAHPSDTDHDVYQANLKGNAVLHRFKNKAGFPYSAIYVKDMEIKNNPRELEHAMIAYYQATYKEEVE